MHPPPRVPDDQQHENTQRQGDEDKEGSGQFGVHAPMIANVENRVMRWLLPRGGLLKINQPKRRRGKAAAIGVA